MDFCEGGEGSASGPSGKTSKVSAVLSPEKPPPLPLKKDNVPVLPSSLPNESALVPDSEDDSYTNETLHNAETIPDKAHAPMSPSPLSPRRTRVSDTMRTDDRAANSSRPSILILFRSYHIPALLFHCP